MKLGDKAVVRGFGRLREGIIDKLTPKCAWVRYSTPTGGEHVTKAHRTAVFPTLEAAQAHALEEQRERAARMEANRRRYDASAQERRLAVSALLKAKAEEDDDVSYIDFGTLEVTKKPQ